MAYVCDCCWWSIVSNEVFLDDSSQLEDIFASGSGIFDESWSAFIITLPKYFSNDQFLYFLLYLQLPSAKTVLFIYNILFELVDQFLAFLF